MSCALPVVDDQSALPRVVQRLFIGNFDFEHRLCDPKNRPSAKLLRLNAELATSWLAIAREGDFVWTPEPIDHQFFRQSVTFGLPSIVPVASFNQVPRDVQCVPWGWSDEIEPLIERYGWGANFPSSSAVKWANSRATSFEFEQRWSVGLDRSRRIESLAEIETAIRELNHKDDRWVIKAEFGMSARERILGRGPMTVADHNWARQRLANNGILFFEPWVERIGEIGIQLEIPSLSDQPRLVGITPLLVNAHGQYSGNWCVHSDQRFRMERGYWPQAVEVCLRAAEQIQAAGYYGPLGIDAMVYRDADGATRLRPLQDINARWTMGRLALGFQRLLTPGQEAVWEHGDAGDSLRGFSRIVPTSPELVGGMRCRSSRLRIWPS